MKKIFLLFSLVVAVSLGAQAQESFGLANSASGTTLNTLTKVVVNAGSPQAQVTATTDTSGAVGITTAGNGASGTAIITRSGIAPCVFDNPTTAGDYVQISAGTAGNCHDVGATRPTSGQIIGIVIQAGGSAGTYNVLLDKSIFPSAAGTAPACQLIASSDTLTAPGTFATTCAPTLTLAVGSVIEIEAHGVYTTTATASPAMNMQINAGGTAGLCSNTANLALGQSKTNAPWDVRCFIQIATLGAPGTAYPWGGYEAANPTGSGLIGPDLMTVGPFNYTTNAPQTFSVQETATLVTGESFTLQSLFVRQY